jgi:hypothetical protein
MKVEQLGVTQSQSLGAADSQLPVLSTGIAVDVDADTDGSAGKVMCCTLACT